MSDSTHKGHVTEIPDVSYIKNVDVTHETSDVSVSGIARFVVGLVILMIVVSLGMWLMFIALQNSETAQEDKNNPRSPMALSEKESMPPEPRLQGAPGFGEGLDKRAAHAASETPHEKANAEPTPKDALWEIQKLNEEWHKVLKNGPVDEHGQPYGMPIDKAKEEVLKELPMRKQ